LTLQSLDFHLITSSSSSRSFTWSGIVNPTSLLCLSQKLQLLLKMFRCPKEMGKQWSSHSLSLLRKYSSLVTFLAIFLSEGGRDWNDYHLHILSSNLSPCLTQPPKPISTPHLFEPCSAFCSNPCVRFSLNFANLGKQEMSIVSDYTTENSC